MQCIMFVGGDWTAFDILAIALCYFSFISVNPPTFELPRAVAASTILMLKLAELSEACCGSALMSS